MSGASHLERLSDDELLRRLSDLVERSRVCEAELVAHIGEVDARRLYAREAAPSMFVYCTRVLHLSEAEAWLRITAARAAREHPMLLSMLRDGRLHLSAIRRLVPHLTRENRELLLERAAHQTRREVEALVAELAPRPDVPSRIRRLPQPRPSASFAGATPSPGSALASGSVLAPGSVRSTGPELSAGLGLGPDPVDAAGDLGGLGAAEPLGAPGVKGVTGAAGVARVAGATGGAVERLDLTLDRAASPDAQPGPGPARPETSELGPDPVVVRSTVARSSRMEPLAPARYKVEFRADEEFRLDLERLQSLMRSSIPDGDLGILIKMAVAEKVQRLEAKRFAKAKKPRKSLDETDVAPRSRHIPAAVRRAVYERDEGRCAYTDRLGRRCQSRGRLEFHHHAVPYARGGDHSPANVRLMCRTHNALLAEQDYGKEKMARHRKLPTRQLAVGAAHALGSPALGP